MARTIDTEQFSLQLRSKSVDLPKRRLLVTNYIGTEQEKDLTEPPNCRGFGRIRHFRRTTSSGWPENPLPIDPACNSLGLPKSDQLRSQAFQNAACNWRCWYCFVPFSLLSANQKYSAWLSAEELVDFYSAEDSPPFHLDLTGGQPDLVPEWVPWMMEALRSRNLDKSVYLWSDDNLSNDFFWRFLTDRDRELIAAYPHYGRVCCFKGFDEESFAFNTCAAPELFAQQFSLMKKFIELGIDLYGYVTLTTPTITAIEDHVRRFVDSLQELDSQLPLRVIPLEIKVFSPVASRLTDIANQSLQYQQRAIERWQVELDARFSSAERLTPISAVRLKSNRRKASCN